MQELLLQAIAHFERFVDPTKLVHNMTVNVAQASGAAKLLLANPSADQTISTHKLILALPTTSTASLNLPHGVAPTSPINGDIWTTTTAIFVRINGSTVQLAAVAGSGVTTFNTRSGAVTLTTADVTTVLSGAALTGAISVNGSTGLPAAVTTDFWIGGGFGGTNSGRLYIGDGSGKIFRMAKRTGSVDTDLITFKDDGTVSAVAFNGDGTNVTNVNAATLGGNPSSSFATDFTVVVQTTGTSLTATKNHIYIINLGTPGTFTVNLPASPVMGDKLYVVDGAGNSAIWPIQVIPAAGNVNGQPDLLIASNFASILMVYNGTQWNII